MSTDVTRPATAATLAQFPWQQASASSRSLTVRPLLTGDPDAAVHHLGARDLVLPSVIAERAGVAEHEGYQRGFAAGEQAGREAARLRAETHLSRLVATIEELSSLRTAMLHRSELDIVRLSIAIAERIVRREVSVNPQVLSTMAHAAARKLGEHCLITIQMHPDDLLAATGGRSTAPDEGPVRLTADETVPPGGCLVQSAFGTIDIGVDAQIREIARELLGADAESDFPVTPVLEAESSFPLHPYLVKVARADPAPVVGHVTRSVGLLVESIGPAASVGDICEVRARASRLPVEVVGFRDGRLLSVPLGETAGIRPGDRIVAKGGALTVPVGENLLGRVIDGLGHPIDGLGPIATSRTAPLRPDALNPMDRESITRPIGTGVRAIDALLTCGRGQRIGIFGGSGVGKSTLLGMMARGTEADVVVLGLVGERGREVRSFLEHDLGPRGLARSVVVVSTSDSPPLARQRAAYAATAIAESFRDAGKNVLLMMDSVTRFAMAQREIGLAAGEPPTAKGYPPSVFARLPGLLERAGTMRDRGSITAFYTVLVEGDDHNEPVADAVRAILDGHIVLSRDLAARNHYPAIDVLPSVSRTMPAVTTREHRTKAAQVREWLATIRDNEDLISVGAYVPGSNSRIDTALAHRDAVDAFLCQPADTTGRSTDAIDALLAL